VGPVRTAEASPRFWSGVRRVPIVGQAFAARSAPPLDSATFFENVRSPSHHAVIRGGEGSTIANGVVAGVFSVMLNYGPTTPLNWGGFRCAFSPCLSLRLDIGAVIRGGFWGETLETHSGVFASYIGIVPTSISQREGFRCATFLRPGDIESAEGRFSKRPTLTSRHYPNPVNLYGIGNRKLFSELRGVDSDFELELGSAHGVL